eukprot:11822575-Prorocentrum_lima.AAC.1
MSAVWPTGPRFRTRSGSSAAPAAHPYVGLAARSSGLGYMPPPARVPLLSEEQAWATQPAPLRAR